MLLENLKNQMAEVLVMDCRKNWNKNANETEIRF